MQITRWLAAIALLLFVVVLFMPATRDNIAMVLCGLAGALVIPIIAELAVLSDN